MILFIPNSNVNKLKSVITETYGDKVISVDYFVYLNKFHKHASNMYLKGEESKSFIDKFSSAPNANEKAMDIRAFSTIKECKGRFRIESFTHEGKPYTFIVGNNTEDIDNDYKQIGLEFYAELLKLHPDNKTIRGYVIELTK